MDFPRLASIHNVRSGYEPRQSSQASLPYDMPSQSLPSRGPMAIPSKSVLNLAPPPLPPPPRINDLENGHDIGWLHANLRNPNGATKLAPINPSSSLYGGHHHRRLFDSATQPAAAENLPGRGQLITTDTRIKVEPPPPMDGGFRNNSILTNLPDLISTSLKGEQDPSRRCAYDEQLLAKIGKPLSPRQSISLGSGSDPSHRTTLAALNVPPRSLSSLPSPNDTSLDGRWYHNSPLSGGVSPGTRSTGGWKDYMDCRSPSAESSAPSSAVDYDHHVQYYPRDTYRRRGGTTPQRDDSISLPSRSNRGSYDQSICSDIEGEFLPSDEFGQARLLVQEPTPPYLDGSKSSGMKRRASSPPRETGAEDRHSLHPKSSSSDLTQRRTSGHPFSHPSVSLGSGFVPSRGSLSAASSISLRTGSYSSTGTFSIAGTSMTSVSSSDRSPGGLSPNSDLDPFHEKSSLNPSPPNRSGTRRNNSVDQKNANPARKLSVQASSNPAKPAGTKLGGLYICDCCRQKPKKFDSLEELRAHEMEKQYSCQFCNNRFKNKNEAERHQNSLHLRRHSWSCAALAGYQAAFHATTPPDAQTGACSSHDTCGYCGEEFPNFPQPDWVRRFEHLTSVHKFGECNNAKKFFRADHFRQHLKHSHAGASGKWTNILENACMKDEPLPEERRNRSPSTSISGPRTSYSAPSTTATGTLSSNAIGEVLETTDS
ncbi:hypothetical protein ASPZODRAFT_724893 [Penicilliopsis zonata CBS 506.65]|uniref:C2H2-type domain-containing protein n=1 Tax=Penicilliopsis zonata CBS 506.65 TaxID=1073090 RepID=A0A1L9SCA0_9EURO|nr:hypothetical protein ASPZODRAFT_724893 [Penicilliopsis zonata CBS 506.65]OJJ44727.1 hypothetical protein ASPZODRAFT_724893 [Penicilliopsis zonata CBS 506.65]